jgi:serine/threonine-protein kinase
MYSPLKVGSFLHQRYHIRQVLRQGRWGWIYLAHDRVRSVSRTQSLDKGQSGSSQLQDHCVLEEWIVLDGDRLEELQEVLHHEFRKFNQIRNAHLPEYHVAFIHQQRLYCVREWIQGDTYRSLLSQRLAQGQPFLEAEVRQFLETLLPVLAVLHKRDILHQHLTPDCILLRKFDRQPVLVEFGLQAELPIEFFNLELFNHATESYAPLEQRLGERIAPDSDLYALAAIVLVLLTGCEPEKLYDDKTQRWVWQPWISLSPQFASIFDRMLSPNPKRRYASANKVIQALRAAAKKDGLKNDVSTQDAFTDVSALPTSLGAAQAFGEIALAVILIALAGIAAWRIIFHLQPTLFTSSESPIVVSPTPELATQDATQSGSSESSSKPTDLKNRRRELAIRFDVFNQLVDELFYTKYPKLKNQSLDESKQSEWDKMANALLDKLASLSQEARADMGNYNRASYNTWLTAIKPLNVTGRSIEALTDTQLVYLFPELQGKQINPRTLGQIWYAIAHDQISAVKNGDKLKPISSKAVRSETLNAGQGNLYTVQLQQGQNVKLSLKAPAGSLRLSIFPPSENASALLKRSTELQWSGKIEQSGIYEIAIASNTRKAIKYELKIDKDK